MAEPQFNTSVTIKTMPDFFDAEDLNFDESYVNVKDYCRKHNLAYYAAPAEKFSRVAAMQVAIAQGCNGVLVESLS